MSSYTQGRRDGYNAGYEAGLNAGDTLVDHATEFRFLLYPEGCEYWDIAGLAVTVAWRGEDRWAVLERGFCYDADGDCEYESIPSDRSDEFKARYRFDRVKAVRIAREVVVPQLRAIWDERLTKKAAAVSGLPEEGPAWSYSGATACTNCQRSTALMKSAAGGPLVLFDFERDGFTPSTARHACGESDRSAYGPTDGVSSSVGVGHTDPRTPTQP